MKKKEKTIDAIDAVETLIKSFPEHADALHTALERGFFNGIDIIGLDDEHMRMTVAKGSLLPRNYHYIGIILAVYGNHPLAGVEIDSVLYYAEKWAKFSPGHWCSEDGLSASYNDALLDDLRFEEIRLDHTIRRTNLFPHGKFMDWMRDDDSDERFALATRDYDKKREQYKDVLDELARRRKELVRALAEYDDNR